LQTINHKKHRVFLVGATLNHTNEFDTLDHLEELAGLCLSLDFELCGQIIVKLHDPNPKTLIGSGKVVEISELVQLKEINIIIFDEDLTGSQIRNLEEAFNINVMTRSEIILEIFKRNAKTFTSKTQVEIARLNYMLPRLRRQWEHLERQRGGIGVLRGGVGEKQIEIDRRIIKRKIFKLEKDLKAIDTQRNVQRERRLNEFKVGIIGYTNAGKSTIFKALTGYDAFIENKLFATLDSKLARLAITKKPTILISDTVGFIRKLPHHLIEAFKSTLEEIKISDLLLNVIDLSYKNFMEHIKVTSSVLEELAIDNKPIIYVFNKIDKVQDDDIKNMVPKRFQKSILVSGLNEIGISDLKEIIFEELTKKLAKFTIKLPYADAHLLASIRNNANVLKEEYDNNAISLTILTTPAFFDKIQNNSMRK
jgi:GTP-binding protein HflX